MKSSEIDDFQALLTQALGFYGQATSPFAMSVWWSACEPFSLEQVRKALTAHAMDAERGHFPPKPADLVRQLQGTVTDRSLLAWGLVHGAMSSIGAYRSVVFDDPAIHAVITDMGGWPKLCASKVDELPFLQKRFCEGFRAYTNRGAVDWPPVLSGLHALENAARGRNVEPPELIGYRNGCDRVMRGPEPDRLAGALKHLELMP